MVGVHLLGLEKELILVAFYRRPGEVVENGSWKSIIDRIGHKKNVLCVGDFNAHSQVWNCEKTDRNGEILLEEMEETGLFIINRHRDTLSRIGEGGRKHSNLDLGFGTEDVVCIAKYSQKDDSWGSDHYPIEFDVGIERKVYRKKTNRISTKNTDWKIFEQYIEEREEMIETSDYKEMNNHEKYDRLIRIIRESVRLATYENNKENFRKENKDKISIINRNKGKEEENFLKKLGANNGNNEGGVKNKINKNGAKRKRNPVTWWDEECSEVIEERKKPIKYG